MLEGPVEPWQPPRLFKPMTKNLSVSMACPAHHVVPPADVLLVVGVIAGHMVMSERRADQDGVGLAGIQFAVSFVHQFITGHHAPLLK